MKLLTNQSDTSTLLFLYVTLYCVSRLSERFKTRVNNMQCWIKEGRTIWNSCCPPQSLKYMVKVQLKKTLYCLYIVLLKCFFHKVIYSYNISYGSFIQHEYIQLGVNAIMHNVKKTELTISYTTMPLKHTTILCSFVSYSYLFLIVYKRTKAIMT